MATGLRRADLDPQTLRAARCDHDFACLDDASFCETVRFTNRDVNVVKCLSKHPCNKRNGYDGMQICTCIVQRKLHGL